MVTLRFDQSSFTLEQLRQGVFLHYDIAQLFSPGDYALSYAPPGKPVDPASPTTTFAPRSGSGAVILLASDPAVPWSSDPLRDKQYAWDVVLVNRGAKYEELGRATITIQQSGPSQGVTLKLAQPFYTYAELKAGLQVLYQIEGTLSSDYLHLLVYTPSGEPASPMAAATGFAPRSGSGAVTLLASDPAVPWSTDPPRNNVYTWDIVLATRDEHFTELARTTFEIMQDVPLPTVALRLMQPLYTYAQLQAGLSLNFEIGGTLPDGEYMLSYAPPGQLANPASPATPFAPRTGIGAVTLLASDGAVPWSSDPPRDRLYVWDIVLASGNAELARVTLNFLGTVQLESVAYDGAKVSATWRPFDSPSVQSYVLGLFQRGAMPGPAAAPTSDTTASIPIAIDTQSFEARVRIVGVAGSQGSVSDGAPVIAVKPAISAVAYDGRQVVVQWSAARDRNVLGYTVCLFEDQALFASQTVSLQTAALPAVLDPSRAYTVSVQAIGKLSAGPVSDVVGVVGVVPEITAVSYDGTQLTVSWGQISTPLVSGYNVVVEQDGVALPPIPVSGGAQTGVQTNIRLNAWNRYSVRAQAVGGDSAGPFSGPVAVLTNTPQVEQVTYDGALVSVYCANLPGDDVTGYALVFTQGGAAGPPVFSGNTSLSFAASLTPTDIVTLQVYAVGSRSSGPSSTPIRVVAAIPALSGVIYDGAAITANWPPVVGVREYAVGLYDGGALLETHAAGDGSATFEAALNPARAYTVSVQAVSGVVSGPSSSPLAVIAVAPVIESIGYADSALSVAWKPIAGDLLISVYEGDQVVQQESVAHGSPAPHQFTAQLSAWKRYAVRMQSVAGASMGPSSGAVAALAGAPAITQVDYDGVRIAAQWSGAPGYDVTGYTVVWTHNGAAQPPIWTDRLQITIPATLAAADTASLTVQALGDFASGPVSAPASVIAGRPMPRGVVYDGELVTATWAPLSGIESYRLGLFQNDTLIESRPAEGSRGTLPARLDPAAAYTVRVQAMANGASGPLGDPLGVIGAAPAITGVTYDGQKTTVRWTPLTGGPTTGYTINVWRGASVTNVSVPGIATGTYDLPGQLDDWNEHRVGLNAVSDAGVGPLGEPVQVIAAAPAITALDYDGRQLTVSWGMPSNNGATSYQVALYQDSLQATPQTFHAGRETLTIALPQDEKSYLLTVRALGNLAAGPESEAANVINQLPALSSATYDGASIDAVWQAQAAPGITGYRLNVFDGDTLIKSQPAGASGGAIEGALDPAKTYVLRLQAAGNGLTGPLGPPLALIAAAPQITSVTYNAGALTVNWGALTAAGVSGYRLPLYGGAKPVVYDVTGRDTATFSQSLALDAWRQYHIRAQATADANTGPASAPVDVLVAAPAITQVDYSGTALTVRWSGIANSAVSGYALTLTRAGVADTPIQTAHTDYTQMIALDGAVSLAVQALGDRTTGPSSDPATVLTQKVSLTAAKYDGANVSVTWQSGAGDMFRINLYGDDQLMISQLAHGDSGLIGAQLSPLRSYTVRVQTLNALGGGPISEPLVLVSAAPTITGVSYDGQSSVHVGWAAPQGTFTSYQINLYEGEQVKQTFEAAANAASFDITGFTPQSGKTYGVRLYAANRGSSGPLSDVVAIITAVPAIQSARYTGNRLDVLWGAIADPAVTRYLVKVFQAGVDDPIYTFVTLSNALSEPATLAATQQYQVKVQAEGLRTSGVLSNGVNPLVFTTGYYFSAPDGANQPYVYRSVARPPATGGAITALLPDIFTTAPASAITSGVFSLGTNGDPLFKYKLTVNGPSLWTFDTNAIRSALRSDYKAFVTQLEAAALKPGALAVVRQAIAQALPLTFAETLYYSYGFDPAGYVDLLPGMRLRLDYQTYQFVGAQDSGGLSGYVGSGSAYVDIGSYFYGGSLSAGFNAFLARLQRPAVPPLIGGGGGIIDLYAERGRRAYYRLLYPSDFTASAGPGETGTLKNVVILGADTIATIETATGTYMAQGNFEGVDPNSISAISFRGRAVAFPEIEVLVNGQPLYVAIGTTVRDVIGQFARLPFRQSLAVGGVTYERAIGNLVDQPGDVQPSYTIPRTNSVYFDYQALPLYSNGMDAFDLPVLQGDALHT
jgi:hypothetical protein